MNILPFLAILLALLVTPSAAQDQAVPVISSFALRPATNQPTMRIGEEAIMEFEYAHVAGGLAKATVEVEFCVAVTRLCMPSSDWKFGENDLAKYPEESGKVAIRRRTTGTRNQDLIYELRITDSQGRKVSRKTTEPLRLRVP